MRYLHNESVIKTIGEKHIKSQPFIPVSYKFKWFN